MITVGKYGSEELLLKKGTLDDLGSAANDD